MSDWHKVFWKWLQDNHVQIISITAIIGTLIGIIGILISLRGCQANNNEATYISSRPDIRIKAVYLKTYPYQQTVGGESVALKFFIPIRNDGDATAYDVEIKRKDLELVRGQFNLKTPSLQTSYTNSPFDLRPRQTIEDTIFIDESPANMQKVLNGEESFSLKYEIQFHVNKNSKSEPFVYQYEIKFSKGQFQNDSVHESLRHEIRP